jgi:hypothetical protein
MSKNEKQNHAIKQLVIPPEYFDIISKSTESIKVNFLSLIFPVKK